MSWDEYKPYVPVAARRAKAKMAMQKLRKKGAVIQPIEIEGRIIARTFWSKAWCDHLEKFSDYENRLPRGRTYVRNGSVCHLEISLGQSKRLSAVLSFTTLILRSRNFLTKNGVESRNSVPGRLALYWNSFRKNCRRP